MREMIFDGEDLIRLDTPIPRWLAFSNDNYVLGLEVNLPQFVTLQERKASTHVRKRLSGCYITPRPTQALWVDIFMFRNDGLSQLQLHRGRSNTEVV